MMKPTFPKSLAEAIKEIRKLRTDLEAAEKRSDQAVATVREERGDRLRAQESEKKTRENFEDLKRRLHNSEMEVARQNGYLERVAEDDRVADPLVEIDGQHGKTFVTKRHPAPRINTTGMDDFELHGGMYGGGEKRKHWTSY